MSATLKDKLAENWAKLPNVLREAMKLAADKPGRHGGRYVARRYDTAKREDEYLVLEDDDPDLYRDDNTLDILAQATPTKVYGIGHARHWINEDGTIEFHNNDGTIERFE